MTERDGTRRKDVEAKVFGSPSDTIKLRAADLASALASGEQITASGSARLCTAGSSTWTTAAKESIDFSGTADLTLSGSEPPLTVNAGAGRSAPSRCRPARRRSLPATQAISRRLPRTVWHTADSYAGPHGLTFAGANSSPNPPTAPTVDGVNFGTPTRWRSRAAWPQEP